MDDHKDNEMLCSECGFQTSSMPVFVDHMKVHTQEKPYECSECGYSASSVLTFENHMKLHTGEKTSESVQQPSELLATNEHKPSDVNKVLYKCENCDFVNSSKAAYDLHIISHSDEILQACTGCAYTRKNKDILNNHYKNKHNIYNCTECDYTGKSEKNLEKHVKTHKLNKIKCTKCDFTCKSREQLAKHMKEHLENETEKQLYSETVKSPGKEMLSSKTNPNKRGISLSQIENKTLRSDSNNKKSRNET